MNQNKLLHEIPEFSKWTEIKPICKGWSFDTKFKVKNAANESFLVRFSDSSLYAQRKKEFETIKKLPLNHLNIPQPIDFGLTKSQDKIYTIYTWIDGIDAEQEIIKLSPKHQYECGRKAGIILRQIHAIPAPADQEPWDLSFKAKNEGWIKKYEQETVKLDYGQNVIRFLRENMNYLHNRPQTLQHGDYHLGNIVLNKIIHKNNTFDDFSFPYEIGIIDFDRLSYGDPWDDFKRCFYTIQRSIPFMNGQIHGYFQNVIPDLFLRLMAIYTGHCCIASIPWGRNFGLDEVDKMRRLANEMIKSYDNFNSYIPNWYHPPNKIKYNDI